MAAKHCTFMDVYLKGLRLLINKYTDLYTLYCLLIRDYPCTDGGLIDMSVPFLLKKETPAWLPVNPLAFQDV